MGFILFWIVIAVASAGIAWAVSETKDKKANAIFTVIVIAAISIICCSVFSLFSYFNTIGAYGSKAKIEQRHTALALYVKHANVPTGAAGKGISDLTDKKYEDYQRYLRAFIDELNTLIEGYNDTVAEKRAMKEGLVFNWFVHCPDDLKVIKMAKE